MSKQKMPTSWKVPDGWVLTWYPPFTFPYAVDADQTILVYDEEEPFLPVDEGPGDGGYNPNVSESTLAEFGGEHPGTYALNIAGEEPTELVEGAIQTHGKKVSS